MVCSVEKIQEIQDQKYKRQKWNQLCTKIERLIWTVYKEIQIEFTKEEEVASGCTKCALIGDISAEFGGHWIPYT